MIVAQRKENRIFVRNETEHYTMGFKTRNKIHLNHWF